MTRQLAVPATCYKVGDKIIPGRLTLDERNTFAIGAGVPWPQAAAIAMQDRAGSLVNLLGCLVAQSGDATLIAKAEGYIEKWNAECDAFFRIKN
jgi:hypothetical protein